MKQKDIDEIALKVAEHELGYWEWRINEYKKAIRNGRCDECNEPLNDMEQNQTTCESCLCPE